MAGNVFKTGLAALVLVGMLAGCGEKDQREAVRALIDKGAEMAEQHNIGDLMELTVKGFTANPGNHNASQVRGILFAAFRHYGDFDIRYPRPAVTVEEGLDTALAVVHFMIVRRDFDIPGLKELYDDPQRWLELASEKADLYQIKLDLTKDGKKWRVRQATLEGFKGWGF
ncbi:MAG: hypothetical protein HY911_12160 [Desulfobacterales bacterium]|nr:hypothetical protein [Desulfobacterales bacterium]